MPNKYVTAQRPTDKDIKIDERILSLKDFAAECMFRQLILEQDNMGRHEASAGELKAYIFPLHSISVARCEKLAQLIHDSGLAFRYSLEGHQYFQLIGTVKRQGMVGNMKRASSLPPPPKDEFVQWLIDKRKCSDTSINKYIQVYTSITEGEVKLSEGEVEGEGEKEKELSKQPVELSSNDSISKTPDPTTALSGLDINFLSETEILTEIKTLYEQNFVNGGGPKKLDGQELLGAMQLSHAIAGKATRQIVYDAFKEAVDLNDPPRKTTHNIAYVSGILKDWLEIPRVRGRPK